MSKEIGKSRDARQAVTQFAVAAGLMPGAAACPRRLAAYAIRNAMQCIATIVSTRAVKNGKAHIFPPNLYFYYAPAFMESQKGLPKYR
jgi:hypothetical protein